MRGQLHSCTFSPFAEETRSSERYANGEKIALARTSRNMHVNDKVKRVYLLNVIELFRDEQTARSIFEEEGLCPKMSDEAVRRKGKLEADCREGGGQCGVAF